jgi:transcription-repair coupling factor (superfamily II helicase)
MIINRADRFGLAQLYQLRGRVGRSHHRAYAYLIRPERRAMTSDAVKRLEAIESLEDLGTGFMLATHDLEIRGAGELLGDEQSGQIQEIGFSLYTELLQRAVEALKSGKEPDLNKPLHYGADINLHMPALIPEDYLPDVHTRLIMYKRISHAEDEERLRELQVEMIDRFGLLPDQVKTLFAITRLKQIATPLGIEKIDIGNTGGRLLFGEEPNIDTGVLINLIQTQSKRYRFDGKQTLRVNESIPEELRIDVVERLLDTLSNKDAA